jgi:hypothetical protein
MESGSGGVGGCGTSITDFNANSFQKKGLIYYLTRREKLF